MGRCYGVATISRLLKIISLFCRISSLLQGSFAKETYIVRSLLIVASPYENDSFFCDTNPSSLVAWCGRCVENI